MDEAPWDNPTQLWNDLCLATERLARAREFVFNQHPDPANAEFSDHYVNEFTVEYRGLWDEDRPDAGDCWAIKHHSRILMRDGSWQFEMRPSEREDEWRRRARFTREEAMVVAYRMEWGWGAGCQIVNVRDDAERERILQVTLAAVSDLPAEMEA